MKIQVDICKKQTSVYKSIICVYVYSVSHKPFGITCKESLKPRNSMAYLRGQKENYLCGVLISPWLCVAFIG